MSDSLWCVCVAGYVVRMTTLSINRCDLLCLCTGAVWAADIDDISLRSPVLLFSF